MIVIELFDIFVDVNIAISCLKRTFRSEIFLLDFSQKILTDLKANFIKFELSTTFRSWDINKLDFPFERLFL